MEKTMKKKMMLISTVLVFAICSGIFLAFAMPPADNGECSGIVSVLAMPTADNGEDNSNGLPNWVNGGMMPRTSRWLRGCLPGRGCFGFVEVSEEFEAKVIYITKSDEDVLALLDDGYEVIKVKPIIKAIVDADGNVVRKATSAIVILGKDTTENTTGRAAVWVDMEEGIVTRIEILTRTVIEKTSQTNSQI